MNSNSSSLSGWEGKVTRRWISGEPPDRERSQLGTLRRGHRRRQAILSPFSNTGHSTSKHKWKRTRKSGTFKGEVFLFLCAGLRTYCVCFRVMAKTSFQLIQLWSQLHGLPLYPQNTNMTTLQDDREIPKNINYLLPHSGNHHQKESWRASARASIRQQMLLCFPRWLTDSNALAK